MSDKKVFSYNADFRKTAYMNWRMKEHAKELNLKEIGRGFFLAAEYLLQNALENNYDRRANSLIFPILYSLDQGIEVYLKAIIRNIELLLSGEANNYTTHNILQLFRDMKALVKKKEVKTAGLDAHFSSLSKYIGELASNIADAKGNPKMDFARYPYDSEGTPYFYISSENIPVDMEYLLEQVPKIRESLDSLYTMYSVELAQKLECMAEELEQKRKLIAEELYQKLKFVAEMEFMAEMQYNDEMQDNCEY